MTRWINRHKWMSFSFFTIIAIILALPYILQASVKQAILNYSQPYGIQQVELKAISLNPFSGTIRVHNLNLYKSAFKPNQTEPKAALTIGQLDINLHVLGLLKKRIWVESLRFSDANLPFRLDDNQQLFLANIPLSTQTETTTPESKLTFLPGLDSLIFNNITFSLAYKKQISTLHINDLSLKQLYAWSDQSSHLQFKTHLNDAPIAANLQLNLFADHPKIVGTLKTQGLRANNFMHFIPVDNVKLSGQLNTDITFTLEQTPQGFKVFEQGEISLIKPSLNIEKIQAKMNTLHWKGDLAFTEQPSKSLDLNGALTLTGLQAKQALQQANFQQAKLTGKLQILFDKTLTLHAKQQLNIQQLTLEDQTNKQQLSTDVIATLNSQIRIDKQAIQLQNEGPISLRDLQGRDHDLLAKLEQINWQGSVNLRAKKDLSYLAKGQLGLQNLMVNHAKKQTTIAQMDSAKLSQLTAQNQKQITTFALNDITLNQLSLGGKDKQPGLVKLKNLTLNQATYTTNSAKHNTAFANLGNLKITGSEAHLSFTKQGEIKQLNQLLDALAKDSATPTKQTKPASDSSPKTPNQSDAAELHYQLASLAVTGNNKVHLLDESLPTPVRKVVQVESFNLGSVASDTPKKTSDFNLKLVIDEFSTLVSKGHVSVLEPTQNFEATTQLHDLSLLDLSPIAEQTVGYKIESGQLSADLKTKLVNNQIEAQNTLHLNKLSVKSIDNRKSKALQNRLPIPLEEAVSMLQNKNNNITLSLPIQGDINNPNFNVNDVISIALSKALAGATRSYLLLALQPFGTIALLGEMAVGQISAISLQAVEFVPGSAQITPKMHTYLKKLNQLLSQRKAIQIQLCEGASEADRLALTNSPLQTTKAEQPATIKSTISRTQLLQLATQRQKAIKRQLQTLGTPSKQVILCNPTVSSNTTTAQVKLKI